MGPFHNRGVDGLSLLEETLILDSDLPALPIRALLESPRREGDVHHSPETKRATQGFGITS